MRLQAQPAVRVRGSQRMRGSRAAVLRSSYVEAFTIIAARVCSVSITTVAVLTPTIRVAWRWRSSTLIKNYVNTNLNLNIFL